MNNTDIIDTLEDLQSFVRDYINTTQQHPDYADVDKVVSVLEKVLVKLKLS